MPAALRPALLCCCVLLGALGQGRERTGLGGAIWCWDPGPLR